MEAELRRIAGQYFAPETIESVRVFNRRAIVTLVNAAEDPAGAEAMEKALLAYPEIDKVSVVYTATRRDEGDTRWRIPGKKNHCRRFGQRRRRQIHHRRQSGAGAGGSWQKNGVVRCRHLRPFGADHAGV